MSGNVRKTPDRWVKLPFCKLQVVNDSATGKFIERGPQIIEQKSFKSHCWKYLMRCEGYIAGKTYVTRFSYSKDF